MITIKTRVGNTVIEVSAEKQKHAIAGAAFFQQLPDKCPRCGAELAFTFRTPKDADGNTLQYYGLECKGADRHATSFGQYRDGGNLFYKWNEPWTSRQERSNNSGQQPPQQQPPQQQGGYIDDDPLPF